MSKKSNKRLQRRLEKNAHSRNDTFSRQPILEDAADDDDYLLFSLKNLSSEYDLNAASCTDYIRSQLLFKLKLLCDQTWNKLFVKSKQSGGIEKIDKSAILAPLPSCVTDDISHLYVVRFNGQNSRLIGYRSDNVFQVLFVDVNLEVYKH